MAAGTANSLRGTGVITGGRQPGEYYLFLQLLFFSQGLGRSSDPFKHKPLIELLEEIVPASTIHFGGLFVALPAAPPLGFGVEEAFLSRNRSSLTWSSAECSLWTQTVSFLFFEISLPCRHVVHFNLGCGLAFSEAVGRVGDLVNISRRQQKILGVLRTS